jgi:hypothetical protein
VPIMQLSVMISVLVNLFVAVRNTFLVMKLSIMLLRYYFFVGGNTVPMI